MWGKPTLRKCIDGVSPVVGTILMVAVSVILAAILYVMSTNLINGGEKIPPMIGTASSTEVNNHVWTVTTITGGSILRIDVYVQVRNDTGFVIQTEPLITTGGTPGCNGTHGFEYAPASAGDYIGVGDMFSLDNAYLRGCTITLVTPDATSLYTVMTVG